MRPAPVVAPIPKAELHCHIEGTAAPALARRLAARQGRSLEGILSDDDRYLWHDFGSFLRAYDAAANLFRTEEDFADLAHDYLCAQAAEGALYVEIFIAPDHAADVGLSMRAYVDGLAAGIARAEAETGIVCRMIAVCLRHLGPRHAEAMAREVTRFEHPLLTGFGMAGEERMLHPSDFVRAFAIAGEAGLGLTAHAGELRGPESVRAALDHLGVSRIGHGVRAAEDPDLVYRLAAEGIVLECCPGSNVALGVYGSLADHPLRSLHSAGVRVTLNSDDPPFFATSLAAEYAQAQGVLGFAPSELARFTRTALEAAFVDEPTRARLLARLDMSQVSPR